MILRFLILVAILLSIPVLYRVIKNTPKVVRRASLLILLIGLAALEIDLRLSGSTPYFTISSVFQNCLTQIIKVDDVVDYHVLRCDEFGVNKFTPPTVNHKEVLLNSDGFRSLHEFTQGAIDSIHLQNKKAVLVIGDSYTYGLCADSGYSFASLLENKGKYGILNAGIPGTDVPQYKAIVKEYIGTGKLKPDKVLVCINGANDLNHIPDRKLTPGVPILFYTNVGGLYSYIVNGEDTVFRSAKSAYKDILQRYTIIGIIGEGPITTIIGKSCLASRLIGLFRRKEPERKSSLFFAPDSLKTDPIIQSIKEIKNDCQKYNVPVTFVLLPGKEFVRNKKSPVFGGVISIDPRLFTLNDYVAGFDDHPINSGHAKLADELDKILSSE